MVTRWKNTIRKGKNGRRTLHTKRKRQWYEKYSTSPNKRKKKRKKHVWLSGRLHIEGRLNEEPRLQRKHKDEKAKQNKTKVTPEKDVIASANQTPGGYKFAPLVASQQGRVNQHVHACFGLSSRWSFPSRSGIRLHAVIPPWLPLQRSILPLNLPPLVPPFYVIPFRPGLQSSTGRR